MSAKQARAEPERMLRGGARVWALTPALALAALALLPMSSPAVQTHSLVMAALLTVCGVALALGTRAPWLLRFEPRRPHYMQALTQLGVYLWWGYHWAPVSTHAWHIVLQLCVAYQVEVLLAVWRGRPWSGGFGPLPIVFSINLFLWFRDAHFFWQLAVVALCYLGKELVRWERDGHTRHIFNPSSFGLAIASIVLLATHSAGLTFAREIALTQEETPRIWEALFALGLIVQLQFPVVLVTMGAALSAWASAAAISAATGGYLFVTTDLPAAVFLGMLLLVTDPATSPSAKSGKLLFGAAYGLLVVLLYIPLEAWGSYGYFDKLLPVPLLNLCVRRLDGWCRPWDERLGGLWQSAHNGLHVGVWVAVFGAMFLGHAFGPLHPGRDIAYWQRACQAHPRQCRKLMDLLSQSCDGGEPRACHNLGAELELARARGLSVPDGAAERAFARACAAGIAESCAAHAPAHPLWGRCHGGDMDACHDLAHLYLNGAGVTADLGRAKALFAQACEGGIAAACNSLAAVTMQLGQADAAAAAAAFQRSCEIGDGTGCANLALMLLRGDGAPRDEARAAKLHHKACNAGVAVACDRLADAYRDGVGVVADRQAAERWRALACEQGHPPACAP